MRAFWLDILIRIPAIAWSSAHRTRTMVGTILFILCLLDLSFGSHARQWIDLHPAIPWAIIGIIGEYLIAKAISDKYGEMERENQSLRETIDANKQSEACKKATTDVIDQLAAFMAKGNQLLSRYAQRKLNTEEKMGLAVETEQWTNDVQSYLDGALDRTFLTRFQVSKSMTPLPDGLSAEMRETWQTINAKVEKLEAFIKER